MNLGVVYTQQNKVAKALSTYRDAVKRFPAEAAVQLAFCRFGTNLNNMKVHGSMKAGELIKSCECGGQTHKQTTTLTTTRPSSLNLLEGTGGLPRPSRRKGRARVCVHVIGRNASRVPSRRRILT